MYRRTPCESVGRNLTINQNAEGINIVHVDLDADDAEVDVGGGAQRRHIREELVDHKIERLEKLGVRDKRPAASKKA